MYINARHSSSLQKTHGLMGATEIAQIMSYHMGIAIQRCVQGEMVACEVKPSGRRLCFKFILEEWINNSQVAKGE